jgi:S1-C subfamily serine protease
MRQAEHETACTAHAREIRRRKRFFGDTTDDENYLKLSGSGAIVREDGYILTSLHVVQNQNDIVVSMSDKRTFPAKIANRDSFYDLAVLKVQSTGLPVTKFADANQLRKGEWVIAIGNQMGLEHTVTIGLVSGIAREVKGYSAYGAKTGAVRFIQTDAPVNPGSSGGPLVNLKGEVVGINTFIRDDAQNIGFAIPSNTAEEVAAKLTSERQITHPYIGVEMVDTDSQVSPAGTASPLGVEISTVKPNGPAGAAGIMPGDVITGINELVVARSTPSRCAAGVSLPPFAPLGRLKVLAPSVRIL